MKKTLSVELLSLLIVTVCNGMFVMPGKPETAEKKIQKTGAQLEASKNIIEHPVSLYDNPWVNNVIAKFDALPQKALVQMEIFDPNKLIYSVFFRNPGCLQSIKRKPGTHYMYIAAGGDRFLGKAALLIINMAFMGVGKESGVRSVPENKVVKRLDLIIAKDSWNAGGMDICGKYLVIPVSGESGKDLLIPEKRSNSTIVFYDTSDPEAPTKISAQINLNGFCEAVALARLPDNHYLVATMMSSNILDLYYSKTTQLEDGFYAVPTVANVSRNASRKLVYKNINFVTQADGTLFMVASQRTSSMPTVSGDDYVDLFRIEYDILKLAEANRQIEKGEQPSNNTLIAYAHCLRQKKFNCADSKECNFDAGATLFIEGPDKIALYAIPHYASLESDAKSIRNRRIRYVTIFE